MPTRSARSGLLQPIIARPGSRSAAASRSSPASAAGGAAQKAGLHTVPVIVRELSDHGSGRVRPDRERAAHRPQPDRGGDRLQRADRRGSATPRSRWPTWSARAAAISPTRCACCRLPASVQAPAAGRPADRRPWPRAGRSRRWRKLWPRRIVEEDLNVRAVEALVQSEDRAWRRQPSGRRAGSRTRTPTRAPSRRTCPTGSASRSRSSRGSGESGTLDHQIRQLRPARLHPRPPHRPAGALIHSSTTNSDILNSRQNILS